MTQKNPFRGFRFPAEVILWAVRWYLRFAVSLRDLEEMLAERGVRVDHVSLHRWVQRFVTSPHEVVRRKSVEHGCWSCPQHWSGGYATLRAR